MKLATCLPVLVRGWAVVLLTTSGANAQCDPADLFGPQQQFATGNGPRTVLIGDFDRDGVADIVVTNESPNTVSVLLGNGDGTFQPRLDFDTGGNPRSVATGDFNGDGVPDLVVANFGSFFSPGNTVSVLLGNGDGTFQPRQDFTTGDDPISVVTGDYNLDGIVDIAVANFGSNTVSILLGNRDGTFDSLREIPTGVGPGALATGDINADGISDLIFTNSGGGLFNPGNTISVLLGNGDGTFQAAQNFSTGLGPVFVAISDFNGDGRADVATANSGDDTVSVLLGNGDGTFQPYQDFTTGFSPLALAIGDLDGDGVLDIAVANSGQFFGPGSTVGVLLGNDDGTFQTRQDFATGILPWSVAIGDLDRDGAADLVVANAFSNTVSVLQNQCVQDTSCPADLNGDGDLNFFDVSAFLSLFNAQSPIADFNGDGLFNFFDFSAYLLAFNAGCP